MEPPFKRPRLSIFEDTPPSDEQLDTARTRNDATLKSKWEAIFQKYSRDFTSVADEVDLMTGEIVVNRGHLESMQTETDPGQVDGRSLLRAISAAQDEGKTYPGFEEIVQSIEGIAETVLIESEDDSEDELHRSSRSATPADSQFRSAPREPWSATPLDPYASDEDSLFDHNEAKQEREASVDSLFETTFEEATIERLDSSVQPLPQNTTTMTTNDEDILARFGPQVGPEVIDIIEERRQAHIEPAWRIPKDVQPPVLPRVASKVALSPSTDLSPVKKRSRSIWKAPRVVRDRSQSDDEYQPSDESEDPLQEGFSDSHDQHADDDESTDEPIATDSAIATGPHSDQTLTEALKTGTCMYCHKEFDTKSRLLAHWDRLLYNDNKSKAKDDLHDVGFIRKFRSHVKRRVRNQRFMVTDFRVLVELHEGAGMSFESIFKSEVLSTRKTAGQLQTLYQKHRTYPDLRETPEPDRAWSPESEQLLIELSQNPLTTMSSIRRETKKGDDLAVGNRLADLWLAQMTTTSTHPSLEASELVEVKHEDSGDDLFIPEP